ncbi:superoxide dismutase [Micromonospora sp. NPDC002296]|uniref:superoxide dismutase n=1 Tax=Micromonospora sp. NPDC002296 TaxID=3154271 RepID=UPI00332F47F3
MAATVTRRSLLGLGAALGGAVLLGGPAAAASAAGVPASAQVVPAAGGPWPDLLHLPDGFHPDGIAVGPAPYAWFGSLLGGAIYRADLRTGAGTVIYPGTNPGVFDPRYMALGLHADPRGRLFVGGGWGRVIKVHDAVAGTLLRSYDVGVADSAVAFTTAAAGTVWFTDGFQPLLYGLPLGPRGELPGPDRVVTLTLGGDWVQAGGGAVSASGICPTPDRSALLVVNVAPDGGLFRVDPATGYARRVDLGGLTLPTTNGIALRGRTLYAPRLTDVVVLRLSPDGTCGEQVGLITDPRFDMPSAAAVYADRLYVTNGNFDEPPVPQTRYNAVAVPLNTR